MQDGARGIQIQQDERFNDRFSVQMQSTNPHPYVATRLLRDGTRYWEARRAGMLPTKHHKQKKIRENRTGYKSILRTITTHRPIINCSRIGYKSILT